MKLLTGIVGLGVIAAAAAPAIGRLAFERQVDREVGQLARDAGKGTGASPFIRLDGFPDLPPPVRRYLAFAGVEGRARTRTARLLHDGLFRTGADRDWMPIEGEEYFSVEPPGFVWAAKVRPLPLFTIRARDLYMNGRGNVIVKPLSVVALADARGPELDVSALLRFAAETPWFPTALVPGDHVVWDAIDDTSARIIVRDGPLTVSGIFTFASDGRITRFETQERYQADGGPPMRRPWGGLYDGYEEVDGFRIPAQVEVRWLAPPEAFTYARFEVKRIDYDDMRRF